MRMPAAEAVLLRSVPWLIGGLAVSGLLLLLPVSGSDQSLYRVIGHLSALVAFGFALTTQVAPLTDEPWFSITSASPRLRGLGGAAVTIAVVTFAVALVTLASSAALRYDPSLQFLQLLSAMDIAWVVAAVFIGARWRWGIAAAWIGGILIGVACVWSIWRYLDAVGFTADGGWLVSGPELVRLVIVFDIMAALVAVGVVVIGALRRYSTAQRSPQS